MKIKFDAEKIKRYNTTAPRYTSYPTAVAFSPNFTEADYLQHAKDSNQHATPLSLYFHIPFCDTVCFYCACNKVVTKDYSKADKYLDYLYREIDIQAGLFDQSRIVEQLHWGGGTPTFLNHQQIKDLMAYTRQSFNLLDDDSGDYSIEIDPRSVSKETIKLLREVGFNRFSLGVQDVDDKVQKAVNRIQPIEETKTIIDACRDNNTHSISIDLIYGLPLQTIDSFTTTLQRVIELSPDRLSIFNYAHLPHIFKPQRRINEDDLPIAEDKLIILQKTIEALTDAGYVYIGMDHFAKPDDELAQAQRKGSLHRNFQGYTTHADCDLVAMGVSAISKVNNAYCQNDKNIEAYYQQIDDKHLPIIRGIASTDEDLIRHQIIQQLSCHFTLDMQTIETKFTINFNDYFATEMKELAIMAEDDLLILKNGKVEVTATGRLLIRNICMVFDAYQRKQTGKQQFSKAI
ncbi:MAG: oxygen-independent coproporphyrinogen III oxidase [Thiotrichaceae bacterium]|nr:oxygen-independent coproporphyrinogen III oxidase [Thiotrichaceae bacterium]